MLNHYLHDKTIQLRPLVTDYQQALQICAQPLLNNGSITTAYLQAILHHHHTSGTYYVLAPGLAMPHGRPQQGVLAIGLSLLKLQQGVHFGHADFDPVDIIIMLAATDNQRHMMLIAALAELFSCEQDLALLHKATTQEEIQHIIDRY